MQASVAHMRHNNPLLQRRRGVNGVGQLGDGTLTTRATPVRITEPDASGQAWVEFSLHTETSCAVRSAGDLFCWVSAGATMGEACRDVHPCPRSKYHSTTMHQLRDTPHSNLQGKVAGASNTQPVAIYAPAYKPGVGLNVIVRVAVGNGHVCIHALNARLVT